MISANTIFHFTKSIENIENILTNNFSPRYCLERLDFMPKSNFDIAIPMVCFCDIPLSQITEHVKTYGNYAIGLKKEWAIKNSISPVIYLNNDSRTTSSINNIFKRTAILDRLTNIIKQKTSADATRDFLELLFYCKVYNGKMWRDNKLKENITFYNEREWRYVPKLNELESINPRLLINKKEFDDIENRRELNNKLTQFKLHFTPNEIKYIIISKESQRINMVQLIEKIKGSDFSQNELKKLSSKIISIEQINEDF